MDVCTFGHASHREHRLNVWVMIYYREFAPYLNLYNRFFKDCVDVSAFATIYCITILESTLVNLEIFVRLHERPNT